MVKRTREPATEEERHVGCIAEEVQGHSDFFSELVELIPAKFYVPEERDGEWVKFKRSKSEKAAAKEACKLNSKKAKRLKLDPSAAIGTNEAIKRKKEKDEKESESEEEEEEDMTPAPVMRVDKKHPTAAKWTEGKKVPHAELAARLAVRIEAARSARRADERAAKAEAAKAWRKGATSASPGGKEKRKSSREGDSAKKPKSTPASPAIKSEAGEWKEHLDLSRVSATKLAGQHEKPKRKLSKAQLLSQAEQIKVEVEGGGEKAEKHSWSAAMKRAAGEKVLDDPKLLRKTLKREETKKKKSAKMWEEKVNMQKETRDAKQTKRKDNIKARRDSVVNKRMERRDKKLLRPGFEGRKEGFINA